VSKQVSRWCRGFDGAQRIGAMMVAFRESPPQRVLDLEVVAVTDYLRQSRIDREGAVSAVDLPRSDVLVFELEGGSRIVVRPSGTEPKIKFYYDHRESVMDSETMDQAEHRAYRRLEELVSAFEGQYAVVY
ncbi:MAG: phospho-sugar mutase, partial [Polyangiaceae bacterium]|nr:phospho-sugar mutase [Polyangiaceae bacterium]